MATSGHDHADWFEPGRGRGGGCGRWFAAGEIKAQFLAQRFNRFLANDPQRVGISQDVQERRGGNISALHLLELELARPGDGWPPDELVDQKNHGNHGGEAPEHRPCVSVVGRGLQPGAEAGQAEIALAQHEHFARHQEEPAARDRDDGVPDQPDGAVRKLKLEEALPPAEAIDGRCFAQFARDRLQRRVIAERQVPDLTGEDEDDRSQLHAQLFIGEQRNHCQHYARAGSSTPESIAECRGPQS